MNFQTLARCTAALPVLFLIGLSSSSAHVASADAVRAAQSFLATLTESQRQRVVYRYDDAEQRARWSNLPTGVVGRGGLSLKEMSEVQQQAALALLHTVLSPMGYEKVMQIRMADDDFKVNGSRRGPPGAGRRGRPGNPGPLRQGTGGPPGTGPSFGDSPPPGGPRFRGGDLFGSDLYFISFLGEPSSTSPWMLQFGGHHLALNITIGGPEAVMTPTLTGAQPAMFRVGSRTIRPLGAESDKAVALLQSLDESRRKRAILNYRVADLVLGPGQDGRTIAPEGLQVSLMTDAQKQLLLELMGEWAGIINDRAASTRMAQLKSDLNQTWFAWSGSTDTPGGTNITAYYRIQGPHVVIEYAPQNDEPANHVHTIYRDPTNDYGRSLGIKFTASP
jgi:Protein of unknown function (DUF3500)